MEAITKQRLQFLAGFAVYFGLLWLLWSSPVIYPLKIFVVLLHEISHGLVALATGGVIERIIISPNEGGLCQCPGGSAFLVLSAGYLGSLLWGALILSAARGRNPIPRFVAALIGAAVVAVTLLYVRNAFGLLFGVAFGVALIAAGGKLSVEVNRVLLTALGLTSCLYALLDIKSDIIDRPEVLSDARMLAELTGIPTLIWGILWISAALAFSVWLFRIAFQRASGAKAARREEVFQV
jgi:hypothetical protein